MISCGHLAQQHNVSMTQSAATVIFCQHPESASWIYKQEYDAIKKLTIDATFQLLPQLSVKAANSIKDSRPFDASTHLPASLDQVHVYTDYEFAAKCLNKVGIRCAYGPYSHSVDVSPFNFLLLTTQVKDFHSIAEDKRVCQFPYEGGFVRKDLLSLTVRSYCIRKQQRQEKQQLPRWWNPCFDLSTELHFFLHETLRRHHQQQNNNWIFKPSQGSRALGHKIVIGNAHQLENATSTSFAAKHAVGDIISSQATNSAAVTAAVKATQKIPIQDDAGGGGGGDSSSTVVNSLLSASPLNSSVSALLSEISNQYCTISNYRQAKEMVAQLLVTNPLTVLGRKFDMRCIVFVRSFEPFEAYLHCGYYARVANKEYCTDSEALHDNEVMLSVSAYSTDKTIAAKQLRLTKEELRDAIGAERGCTAPATTKTTQTGEAAEGLDYDRMISTMHDLLSEVFRGVAPSVGCWPRSSAYYSVDVMFDDAPEYLGQPQAKLIEINYMGDWKAMFNSTKSTDDHFAEGYVEWLQDMMKCLATSQEMDPTRNFRL